MLQFNDTNDVPLSSLSTTLESNSEQTFTVRIGALNGYELSVADVPAELTVYARFSGDPDFQNIEIEPLDLSAFAGSVVSIDIKLAAGTIATLQRVEAKLICSPA